MIVFTSAPPCGQVEVNPHRVLSSGTITPGGYSIYSHGAGHRTVIDLTEAPEDEAASEGAAEECETVKQSERAPAGSQPTR